MRLGMNDLDGSNLWMNEPQQPDHFGQDELAILRQQLVVLSYQLLLHAIHFGQRLEHRVMCALERRVHSHKLIQPYEMQRDFVLCSHGLRGQLLVVAALQSMPRRGLFSLICCAHTAESE